MRPVFPVVTDGGAHRAATSEDAPHLASPFPSGRTFLFRDLPSQGDPLAEGSVSPDATLVTTPSTLFASTLTPPRSIDVAFASDGDEFTFDSENVVYLHGLDHDGRPVTAEYAAPSFSPGTPLATVRSDVVFSRLDSVSIKAAEADPAAKYINLEIGSSFALPLPGRSGVAFVAVVTFSDDFEGNEYGTVGAFSLLPIRNGRIVHAANDFSPGGLVALYDV